MMPLLLLAVTADPAEHFEAKVRPLLVEQCQKCHAGDKQKGGLRLDSAAALRTGGDTGPAVVPGDPDKSLLIKAVRGHDPDLVMPPAGKLPDAAIHELEAWVKAGAVWPGPATAVAPAAEAFDLVGRKKAHWAWQPLRDPPGDLDGFIRAKLRDKGLTPSPPADPPALVRRLAFDLTGLPPTPEDAERFAADPSPAAYAALVDQYLQSQQFGERWGRHWLDVVRYADSRGHEFDHPIPYAWRYRDWVIRAFNADLPLKQFLTEQIAGDRVDPPRRGPDGGNESALGAGFWLLGEEVHSPVDIRQDQADRFDNRIDVFGKAVLGLTVACARCHDHKFDAIRAKDYYSLFALLEASPPRYLRLDGATDGELARQLSELRGSHSPAVEPKGQDAAGVVVDYSRLKPGDWLADGPGFGAGPVPAGGVVFDPRPRRADRTAAVSDPLFDALAVDEPEPPLGAPAKVLRPGLILRTPTFTVGSGKVYALVRGGGASYAAVGHHTLVQAPLHTELVTHWKPTPGWRWECHDLSGYRGQTAHLQLSPARGQVLAVAAVVQADAPPPVPPAEAVPPLDPADADRLRAGHAGLGKQLRANSRVGMTLWEGLPQPGRVFVRGSHKSLGEVAPPRLLEGLAGPDPLAGGRLALAEQATDPAVSPLTFRTFANRLWHHLFGRGLVPTPDNLGALGEPPSHPELLDWLASRLVAEAPKQVIRRIVLSDAYRQTSRADAAADAADPGNVLVHRQSLRRLESEAVRDAMLAVSGRLDRTPFGPPVPVHVTAHQDGRGKPQSGPLDGAGRRTVYVGVRRNFLSPFQLAFDAPSPFGPVGKRTVSNVPAQALALLNDPFVRQQAETWARAVRDLPPGERLDRMFRQAFARPPSADERTACDGFVTDGDWAGLAHALFNVKEFVYR